MSTEEAEFSVGRNQCRRDWESEAEDSTGSEQNEVTYKIGKTQLIKQTNAIQNVKGKMDLFKVYLEQEWHTPWEDEILLTEDKKR